jgi:ribosomal protein S18 acetylase RimI-like enzyme
MTAAQTSARTPAAQTSAQTAAVEYRELAVADLPAVANLHREVFADHFLGHMGSRFLELFYGEFVSRPGNYGLVAVADGKVVGAVIGSTEAGRLFSDFYRRHFLRLGVTFAGRFVRDGYVRRHTRQRLGHVGMAIRSRLGLGRRKAPAAPGASASAGSPTARLLSIGVASSHRGTGIAAELAARFCARLAEDGVDRVGLSVRNDNPRAIAFYEKTGWKLEKSTSSSISFWRQAR